MTQMKAHRRIIPPKLPISAETESNLGPLFQWRTMIKGVAHKARGLCEKVLCVLIIQHKLFKRFLTAAMHTKFEPVWSTQTCFWDKDFG